MMTPNKHELQQIPINFSPDIDHKDFMEIYRKLFLSSDNPERIW